MGRKVAFPRYHPTYNKPQKSVVVALRINGPTPAHLNKYEIVKPISPVQAAAHG